MTMTKKIFALFLLFAVMAGTQAQIIYKRASASTTQTAIGNLYFNRNGSADQWSLGTEGAEYSSLLDISKITYITTKKAQQSETNLAEALANYVAPVYEDYYVSTAGWNDRARWNLSQIHDPSVCLAEDGYYYMVQTDAGYGNPQAGKGHFLCRRSKNLVDWEFLGPTMPAGVPAWVEPKLNDIRAKIGLGKSSANFADETQFGFWAPCIRKVKDGLYRMYYVITIPGTINGAGSWSERAFIGLMETATPANANSWVDKGYVITNYSDKGLNFNVTGWQNCYFKFNAIDPSYIITPEGEHWLIYGSWHSGIAAVRLNGDTGKTLAEQGVPWGAENEAAYGKLIFTRTKNDRWQGSEAPEIVYHDGYYYLFMAYDALDVPYNTRVLRSKNVDGPYTTFDGVVADATNGANNNPAVLTHPYKFGSDHGWVGISHCAVFDDGQGNWFYVSQQRFPAHYNGNAYSNALMMGGVRSIKWLSNGWPVVMPERYGAVPQAEIGEAEIAGTWEHIDLGYSYGKQKASSQMTFAADGSITSGIWKGGHWSFNAATNTLTANGVELKVQREVDWEASPRTATIVYSGLNGTKSYWGKKVR